MPFGLFRGRSKRYSPPGSPDDDPRGLPPARGPPQTAQHTVYNIYRVDGPSGPVPVDFDLTRDPSAQRKSDWTSYAAPRLIYTSRSPRGGDDAIRGSGGSSHREAHRSRFETSPRTPSPTIPRSSLGEPGDMMYMDDFGHPPSPPQVRVVPPTEVFPQTHDLASVFQRASCSSRIALHDDDGGTDEVTRNPRFDHLEDQICHLHRRIDAYERSLNSWSPSGARGVDTVEEQRIRVEESFRDFIKAVHLVVGEKLGNAAKSDVKMEGVSGRSPTWMRPPSPSEKGKGRAEDEAKKDEAQVAE